jgi:hypothetical protein
MANGASIEVTGLETTLRALKIIDPEANKAFRKGFRDAAEPILGKAKKMVDGAPLSGWGKWGGRLDFQPQKVRSGVRTQISARKGGANLRLVNANAAGAVYETAGSRNSSSKFNTVLTERYGPAPRLLVRTWKEERGIRVTYTAVGKLIADAQERVQRAVV